MKTLTLRTSASVIGLAALGFITPALAQQASSTNPPPQSERSGGLEEIVVTAQKRAENIQDVPVAVSAFSPALMKAANIQDVSNLQGLVPGMVITRSGASPSNPFVSLRGISLQDVEKSAEPGIGIVIDGVPLGFTAGALLDAFDIERIEILRGPQGTLFGKNTTGGTINVVRTKPDASRPFSGKVRVGVGSFDNREIKGLVYVPLVTDQLAIKAGFNLEKNEGPFKNIAFGGRNGDRDFQGYQFAVRATPTPELDVTISYEKQIDNSEYVPFLPAYVPYPIALDLPSYVSGENIQCTNPFLAASCTPVIDKKRNEAEVQQPVPSYFHLDAITLDGSYDFGSVKLVAITGYRNIREKNVSDFDGTRFAIFRDERTQRSHQFTQEIRLESNFSGPLKLIGGAFYYNGEYTTHQRASLDMAGLAPIAPGASFLNSISSYNTTIGTRSFALFAQAELEFLDQFKIITGARQTWDRKRIDATLFAPVASTTREFVAGAIAGTIVDSAKFKKFTPKVIIQYNPSSRFQAYASYSIGYNTGGFNGRAATVALVGPYKPETLDAYEIGFKSEFFDRRVRLNVAAYHNILKNKQEDLLLFVGSSQGSTTLNAAKARYNGVEVELTLAPIEGWTISSSTGFLDAKYLNYVGDLGQGLTDLSGLKLRRTPRWTQGLVSDYSFEAGPGTVGLGASMQYVSRYETTNLNDPRYSVPATARFDLNARYNLPLGSGSNLELIAFVKNLTDNTTWSGGSSGGTRGTFIEEIIPTQGRTWGLSATVDF